MEIVIVNLTFYLHSVEVHTQCLLLLFSIINTNFLHMNRKKENTVHWTISYNEIENNNKIFIYLFSIYSFVFQLYVVDVVVVICTKRKFHLIFSTDFCCFRPLLLLVFRLGFLLFLGIDCRRCWAHLLWKRERALFVERAWWLWDCDLFRFFVWKFLY